MDDMEPCSILGLLDLGLVHQAISSNQIYYLLAYSSGRKGAPVGFKIGSLRMALLPRPFGVAVPNMFMAFYGTAFAGDVIANMLTRPCDVNAGGRPRLGISRPSGPSSPWLAGRALSAQCGPEVVVDIRNTSPAAR